MHIPLTKKNVTLVGQTITPNERVSAILRFLATGRPMKISDTLNNITADSVTLFLKPVTLCKNH